MMEEPDVMDRQWRRNFRAALAAFIIDQMPVADPHTDNAMVDAAWRIADRLEWLLVTEFDKVLHGESR